MSGLHNLGGEIYREYSLTTTGDLSFFEKLHFPYLVDLTFYISSS